MPLHRSVKLRRGPWAFGRGDIWCAWPVAALRGAGVQVCGRFVRLPFSPSSLLQSASRARAKRSSCFTSSPIGSNRSSILHFKWLHQFKTNQVKTAAYRLKSSLLIGAHQLVYLGRKKKKIQRPSTADVTGEQQSTANPCPTPSRDRGTAPCTPAARGAPGHLQQDWDKIWLAFPCSSTPFPTAHCESITRLDN